MHTTPGLNEEVTFIHNGDFSGNIAIVIEEVPADDTRHGQMTVEEYGSTENRTWRVRLPFEELRHIVAKYVRDRKIEALEIEIATDDQILGL